MRSYLHVVIIYRPLSPSLLRPGWCATLKACSVCNRHHIGGKKMHRVRERSAAQTWRYGDDCPVATPLPPSSTTDVVIAPRSRNEDILSDKLINTPWEMGISPCLQDDCAITCPCAASSQSQPPDAGDDSQPSTLDGPLHSPSNTLLPGHDKSDKTPYPCGGADLWERFTTSSLILDVSVCVFVCMPSSSPTLYVCVHESMRFCVSFLPVISW